MDNSLLIFDDNGNALFIKCVQSIHLSNCKMYEPYFTISLYKSTNQWIKYWYMYYTKCRLY